MKSPEHVAIIGCGFAGTSAFFQLVDRCPVKRITIFEVSGRFGPGYPYRPDECPDYLINNTTDTMCLAPSNRRAFLGWLRGRPGCAEDLDEQGHLPRAVFGAFLEEVFCATRTIAAVKAIDVRLVPAAAQAIREDEQGRVHITSPQGEVAADMVLLTCGRCPDIGGVDRPGEAAGARYVASHIRSRGLDDLPMDARVHVLGASLSAYDVVNRLFSADTGCRFERDEAGAPVFVPGPNHRHVILCSRSGRLKNVQSPVPTPIRRRHFTLSGLRAAAAEDDGLTLKAVAGLIRREAEAHGAALDWEAVADPYAGCGDADAVNRRAGSLLEAALAAAKGAGPENFLVDFFGDAQVDIWDAFAERLLTPGQERLYRRTFETAVLSYAAPCPVPTAERLLALHRAGRLSLVKGVGEVSLAADGSHYQIAHEFGSARAAFLVNTMGQVDRRVTSPGQSALTRNLAASGLLSPYCLDGVESDGAAVDMTTFRAKGASNIYLANMFLWGPGFFTSSAFLMATIVERLLDGVFGFKQDGADRHSEHHTR